MKPLLKYWLLVKFIIITLCFTSCDTDVPVIDTTPPTYSFTISGDNFSHTFTEKDDPSTYQVNLKFGVAYNFAFISYDKGGVINSEIIMQTEEYLNLNLDSDSLSQQWTSINRNFLTRELDWPYQSGNQVTIGSFLQGNFTFIPISFGNDIVQGESRDFYIRVSDFGGENHNFNQTTNSIPLNIATDNQTSEVIMY